MKFSFLVCVYNGQEYIKECLDSLVKQKFPTKDYEIVVVNDGSTDRTKSIVERYAKKHSNIKLVNKKNEGLSPTRNVAFDNSKGEWLLYVDADDYVSLNLLKEVNEVIKNNKGINFVQYFERKDKVALLQDKKVQSNKMDDSIVCRAIHRSIMKTYKFPKHKFAIEDWDFYVHNLHKLKSFDLSNNKKVWYHYRYNPESLSKAHKVYRSRLLHAIEIFENEETRRLNLDQGIIGHYWEHLYMLARVWFPDLLPRVKKIKYKTKIRFSIKLQYWVVRARIFNWFIKFTVKKVEF